MSRAIQIDPKVATNLILERCAILSRCTESPGAICRTFLSPAMEEAHVHLRTWMEQAGLAVRLDRAGNILASTRTAWNMPRLLIGSHLDTVPNAGAYDGVLGVVLALSLAEARPGEHYRFAIDVVGFSEEEGVRFSAPFLGSKAMVGRLGKDLLVQRDQGGVTLEQALAEFEAAHPEAIAPHLANDTRGYLEFHIEQGPVLDELGLPLGVVTAIAGQIRGVMTFTGKAGHAGTTPMKQRQDALAGAAEWIGKVEEIACVADGLVATVGQISAEPGAINVIPGLARCSLDLRHAEDSRCDAALGEMVKAADNIARMRGVKCEWKQTHAQAAVPMDAGITGSAARAVERAGYPVHRMASGAGHDAMILAPHVLSGMIFLRSPGGLSHHPDESVLVEDVAAAFMAGLNFLDEFERAVGAGERTSSA